MRYVLSGIAGVIVSFSLFLAMTYMIKVEGVEVTPPPPTKTLVFVEPEEIKPDNPTKEPPTKPSENPGSAFVDRIDYPVEDIKMGKIPLGPIGMPGPGSGGDPTFVLPPMFIEPESRFPPRYPTRLLSRGIEGYVLIENTINSDGRVVHVEIIESSNSGFDSAVKSSVVRWTYAKSDMPQRTHREKVAFKIDE